MELQSTAGPDRVTSKATVIECDVPGQGGTLIVWLKLVGYPW